MKLGAHIPLKKLTTEKLMAAIEYVQQPSIKQNAAAAGDKINNEDGLGNAIKAIEEYFAV